MIHLETVEKYAGDLKELSADIGNLRYDALADFLKLLADKIQHDGEKDKARGRVKLAENLFNISQKLNESAESAKNAWVICEKFM